MFLSSLAGSLIPIIPFVFLAIGPATAISIGITLLTLFILGYYKGKLTTGKPLLRGAELGAIGIASALAGYFIGDVLGKGIG